MTTDIEGPNIGGWLEKLPNGSTREKGVADSSKW